MYIDCTLYVNFDFYTYCTGVGVLSAFCMYFFIIYNQFSVYVSINSCICVYISSFLFIILPCVYKLCLLPIICISMSIIYFLRVLCELLFLSVFYRFFVCACVFTSYCVLYYFFLCINIQFLCNSLFISVYII